MPVDVFAPAQIPGVTTPQNNDPIASWPDSSPAADDFAQTTAANKPLYKTNVQNGQPTLRFDGSNDYMVRTGALTLKPVTLFCVFKRAVVGADHALVGAQVTGGLIFLVRGTDKLQLTKQAVATIATSVVSVDATAFHIAVASYSTTGVWALRFDRAADSSGTNDHVIDSAIPNLGSQAAASRFMNGDFAEVVCYNRVLTAAEIAGVEDFLADRWGLGAGTPTNPGTIADLVFWLEPIPQVTTSFPPEIVSEFSSEIARIGARELTNRIANYEAAMAGGVVLNRDLTLFYKQAQDAADLTVVEGAPALVALTPVAKDVSESADVALIEAPTRSGKDESGERQAEPVRLPYSDPGLTSNSPSYMGTKTPSTLPRTVQALESGAAVRLPYSAPSNPMVESAEKYQGYPTPDEELRQNLRTLERRQIFDPCRDQNLARFLGLQLWLKADALTLAHGASVSSWEDSSGKGNHAVFKSGSGGIPTFRKTDQRVFPKTMPHVFWDTGSNLNGRLEVPYNASLESAEFTLVVVARAEGETSFRAVVSSGLYELSFMKAPVGTDIGGENIRYQLGGLKTLFSNSTKQIYKPRFNLFTTAEPNGVILLYRRGVRLELGSAGPTIHSELYCQGDHQQTSPPEGVFSSTGVLVGIGGRAGWADAGGTQGGSGYNGRIAEIAFWNRLLSPQECREVQVCLAAKYGIELFDLDPEDF